MSEVETNGNDKGQIYSLIAQILKEVGPISKGRRNEQQGYKFRGIDDVYAAVHPLFAQHGVFTVPRILSEQTTERTTASGTVLRFVNVTMAYDFFAPDGSSVTAEMIGEAMDAGDKASNKAMSAAHKYALIQTLCIPCGLPDTEEQTHEVTSEAKPISKSGGTASEKCPDCGGAMWDNRTTKKGKQPDYKCKDKACNKAIWLAGEERRPKTESKTDAAVREEFFNIAETYMIRRNFPEDKRKDALGRLVQLSTDEMGKAVDKLVTGTKPDTDVERTKKILEIQRDADPKQLDAHLQQHFPSKALKDLDLDAIVQIHSEFVVPF